MRKRVGRDNPDISLWPGDDMVTLTNLKKSGRTFLARAGLDIRRRPCTWSPRCVSLRSTVRPARGSVLLAYVLEPFLLSPGEPVSTAHTHHSESLLIARTWLDLGFDVDVIDYRNDAFVPRRDYRFFVCARTQFDRLAPLLPDGCVRIAHLDTAHFLFNNHAAFGRALDLQRRRGVTCTSIRIVETNRAIELADYGALLGGEFLRGTYAYAGKPLYCLPVPTLRTYPSPERKDYDAARRRFVWFGSTGFVHKGLDRVLEAFRDMPELELRVCGPIDREPEFARIYDAELGRTPNVRTVGWLDVDGPDFLRVVEDCVALVFPSCAESQSASSLTCMQAGLIPILTREAGIDTRDFGVTLEDASIPAIRAAVRHVAGLPAEELRRRACAARDHARAHHTLEHYRRAYRAMVEDILQRGKPARSAG